MPAVKRDAPRRYAGQTGTQRVQERRQALLEAAFELVAADGWPALRIDALCRHAGLNKRYFYESFPNLDAVTAALTAGLAEEAIAATLAVDEPGLDAEAATRRMVGAFVHHLTDDPRRARVLFGAIPPAQAAAGHRQAAIRQVVAAAANVGQGIHAIADSPPVHLAASMLVGGTSQAILDWLEGDIATEQSGLVDLLVAMWLLVGAEAARRSAASAPTGESTAGAE